MHCTARPVWHLSVHFGPYNPLSRFTGIIPIIACFTQAFYLLIRDSMTALDLVLSHLSSNQVKATDSYSLWVSLCA